MLDIRLALVLIVVPSVAAGEVGPFERIFNFFGLDFFSYDQRNISEMSLPELGVSRGQCTYDFTDYISYRFDRECAPDDQYIMHLLPRQGVGGTMKPPIRVKCLPTQPIFATTLNASLLMVDNVKDMLELLKPIGNATKRHEEGSCVVVFFYTISSLSCAMVAPYVNLLPKVFPAVRVAAFDAQKFSRFNTEYAIVGLPTLILFHQGRPVVKFGREDGDFENFMKRHTNLQPVRRTYTKYDILSPLPLQPVESVDWYLLLAWLFIFLCLGRLFSKSRAFNQIVEMIKRNWRESEAQMEHN